MIHGSIWDKIPRFALPVAATAILGQLFNATDLAVVGSFTGSQSTVSVAAVGANSPIVGLILNLFIGIALGANVVIANAIGRKDNEMVTKAVHTSIILSVFGGILVTILGELFVEDLLGMLHVPEDVFPYALLYLRIYLLGMPVILLYNFEAAIFRSIGDTKMPLLALTFSGVLNVILNLFFVIVLKMTVDGVAWATVIANGVSAVILFWRLRKTDKEIKVQWKKLRVDKICLKQILRIGLPAGLQGAIFSFANIIVQSAINSLGTVVMAASGAALNLEIIAFNVLNSFGQACTTFVGQNHGAGELKRCRRILYICLGENAIATAVTVLLILLWGHPLLSLFNNDPEVIAIGYTRLTIIFAAYTFSVFNEVICGYLRGFGISLTPALLTIFGICVLRILWIHTVFPLYHTFETIILVYPISLATTTLLSFLALWIYTNKVDTNKVDTNKVDTNKVDTKKEEPTYVNK